MSPAPEMTAAPGPVLRAAARPAQLTLFSLPGPLTERLGAEFFRALPASPGVYRFFGEEDRLLYIGQSGNLRARVGSYRFVSAASHSRRLVRMVARARRVAWEPCSTAAAAVHLESRLLLEHRPPFNRAGVWRPDPWWLQASADGPCLSLQLSRNAQEGAAGPLHGAFRYAFGALVRLLHRSAAPDLPWWELPCGLAGPKVALQQQIHGFADPTGEAARVLRFAAAGCPEYLENLIAPLSRLIPESAAGAFWLADADTLTQFSVRTAGGREKAEPAVQVPPSE